MPGPVILLMTVYSCIFLVLPLGSWLLFAGRSDDKTRLWLTGISLLSSGMLLIILRPYLPTYLSHQFAWIVTLASWLIIIELFRRERQRETGNWIWYLALISCWTCYQTWLYYKGETEGLALASHATIMALTCSIVGWNLMLLNRQMPSKNLLLMILAVFLYVVPNIVRVVAYIRTGNEAVMNVFKFSWQANLLSTSYAFAMLSMCFGYWGFTLEKSERERLKAEAGEDEANLNAERYRKLVQERDHLLVMNSRFSSVSALSSFSAMLIHDISQPLQTLQLGLERIDARLKKGAALSDVQDDIKHLEHASERAGQLVMSLRNLMRSGESQVVSVVVKPLFERIRDILDSESLQKKVAFRIECGLAESCAVMCEPTMLQRVIINLVSNSLNQFQVNPLAAPEVLLRMYEETRGTVPGVLVQVIDNGGGFPQEVIDRLGQPWSSKSPSGLGMALVLSKQLLGLWDGDFMLKNRDDGVSGAIVNIWLRQST